MPVVKSEKLLGSHDFPTIPPRLFTSEYMPISFLLSMRRDSRVFQEFTFSRLLFRRIYQYQLIQMLCFPLYVYLKQFN